MELHANRLKLLQLPADQVSEVPLPAATPDAVTDQLIPPHAAPSVPLVSVLVTARDAEDRIVATLDSVLAQNHPLELLELIVVDDGSVDGTAALVEQYAAATPVRVQLVRRPHTGTAAALATAIDVARGDVLALLAAGDTWPAEQLAAQLTVLAERPEVGLVYCELTGAAADEPPDPPRGRPAGRLLHEDCIGRSSIALRATLLDGVDPLPADIPRADRWLAVQAACVAEIEWMPVERAPLDLAAAADEDERAPGSRSERAAALRETLALQRWFLRHVTADAPYADELGPLWTSFTRSARELLASAGGDPFVELLTVTDADRADARRALADAHDALVRGETWPATALAARAAATDPWCAPARELLAETLTGRPRRMPADPLAGARRFVTLAYADELVADPELLAAYGATFDSDADATLAIDASRLTPAAAAEALARLVSELGMDGSGTAHLIAVLGPIDVAMRERLPANVDALLTRVPRAIATPAFDAGSIRALRELAMHAPAA